MILAATLTARIFSGCSGQDQVIIREPEKEKIHLSFLGFKTGADKVKEMEDLLNQYMDLHPEVIITYEGVVDDYNQVLRSRIETGHADDIFMIHPSDLVTLEAEGWVGTKICDLTDENFITRYNDVVKKLITVNGKVFGAPLCMSVIGLAGNMDLLRECGIEKMPETYGEWIEIMRAVKEKGYEPLAGYLGADASPMFLMAGRSIAPYVLGEEQLTGEETAALVFAKGILDISSLMDEGYIDRQVLLENQESRSYKEVLAEDFAKGHTAFAVLPSWGIGAFLSGTPEFEYELGGLPLGDTGSVAMVRASIPVSVNMQSPNREEALKFLDFLMHAEHIEAYAAGQQSLSPLAGAQSNDETYKELLSLIGEGKALSDTNPEIPFNLVSMLNDISNQLANGQPVEEVLEVLNNASQ